jgi:LPXTG-motif cell wall-anchored protein
MKKFAATLAAALLALLGLTALAPSAQAYPTPVLTFTFNLSSIASGTSVSGTATASIDCDTLTINWAGQTASGTGSTLTYNFKAPVVSKVTQITGVATCDFTSTTGTTGQAISPSSETLTAYATVTVNPSGSTTGPLPNTGGPSIGWLVGGLAALLGGGVAMFAGRRRNSTGAASS